MTLTQLLSLDRRVDAQHEPKPRLLRLSKHAFEQSETLDADYWHAVIEAARAEMIFSSNRRGLMYAETSNRLTFLAPGLATFFPDSKFIMLHRHPMEVVRSGLRRGWYRSHPWDWARIVPDAEDPVSPAWGTLSAAEKIGWFWATVNRSALTFGRTLPEDRFMRIASERLFAGDEATMTRLFDFLELQVPKPSAARRVLRAKHNASKSATDSYDEYDLHAAWEQVASIAEELGYDSKVDAGKGFSRRESQVVPRM